MCNLVKKESSLKAYALRTLNRKSSASKTLVYCIVSAKIARIAYAILRDNVPFNPNPNKCVKEGINYSKFSQFTLTDKKLIRRTRNSLRHVGKIQELGLLGPHASELAEQLDLALQGKNFCD